MKERAEAINQDKRTGDRRERLRRLIITTSVTTAYGLLIWLAFDLLGIADLMTSAILFWLPMAIGAISVYFYGWNSMIRWVILPILGISIFFGVILGSGLDGALCLLIIAIPFFLSAILGGILIAIVKFVLKKNGHVSIVLIALFPLLAGPIESQFNGTYEENEVVTTVVVNVPRVDVWDRLISVDSIEKEELSWSLIHAIGVPAPVSSRLEECGSGAIRHITWEQGIRFEEHITEWKRGEHFSYRVVVDQNSIPPEALDKHVRVGGEYFDVLDGGYRLLTLTDSTTLVELRCRYRLKTRFNWYARLWGNYIMDDFQRVILNVIRGRCERNACPEIT
ncbi:MAG: hypothetical protein AB7H80_07405 [Candidatus Kapaibacterium sp.]